MRERRRMIRNEPVRRALAATLVVAGALAMMFAPPVWIGAIPLAIGVALEAIGIAIERLDRNLPPRRPAP
jgi:hypothetical protein